MEGAQPAKEQHPFSAFNLVPLPANAVSLGTNFIPNNAATRPNSLSRLGELQNFLLQCDNPSYYGNYYQLLNSATPDTLQDALSSLKERSQWLEDQQTIEFSRMRSLNMLPEAVNHGHNVAFNTTPHAPNSAPEQYITTLNGIGNDKNVSPTPEIATVPNLPAAELAAAVEHHQLTRDSTTPPNLASIEAKATKSGKKGPVKKSQRKLKRKRTN